jgi:hypothetical protein
VSYFGDLQILHFGGLAVLNACYHFFEVIWKVFWGFVSCCIFGGSGFVVCFCFFTLPANHAFNEFLLAIGERLSTLRFVMKTMHFPRWAEVLGASDLTKKQRESYKVTLRWSRKRLRLTRFQI